jgi:hypothetical protein
LRRSALIVALLVLAVESPAQASRVARPPAPSPMPAIVNAACPDDPDAGGCYYPPTHPTFQHRLYVASADSFTFQHELGHAFDAVEIDNTERARFARLVGRVGAPWEASSAQDRDGLGETFADAYAACRTNLNPNKEWETSTGYTPSARRHRRVCRFLRYTAPRP